MTDKNLLEAYSNDPDRIGEDEIESVTDKSPVSGKKIVLIGLVLGVVLILSGILAWFFVFSDDRSSSENRPVVQKAIESHVTSSLVEKEDFFEDIVNLSPFERIPLKDNANMSLITMKISLELADAGYRQQVMAMEPVFRKIVEEQTKQYTWLELRSSEGKITFKYELLEKLNSQSDRLMIRNLFFTYFLMQ